MWLVVAIALAVVAGLAMPLGQRIQATGLWAGKALTPPEASTLMPRGLQDALTAGWPSNTAFAITASPYAAAVFGFMHAWWAGIAAFAIALFLFEIVGRTTIIPQKLEWYLSMLLAHAMRRQANYARDGDAMRAEVAGDLGERLQALLRVYLGTAVRAPTMRIARMAPFGEADYLLNQAFARSAND